MSHRTHSRAQPWSLLPAAPTRLIGRQRELRALRRRLLRDGVRLLTLVGPPGVGKTRLAIEGARRAADHFNGDVCLVDLAPIRETTHALPAIARALGQEDNSTPAADWLKCTLQGRPLLLVLDNVEQLLPDAAPEMANLLAACPLLSVLATSREALHLRAEHIFHVPPLGVPELTQQIDFAMAKRSPAVTLFVERARDVVAGFTFTASSASVITEICARLDGLPLAIELAAARTSLFDPPTLLGRLQQPLDILTDGPHDLPPRHRTLRAAIAWSYDLLDPVERTLFRRLAVFDGTFTIEAAEHVCGLEENELDLLTSLVRKNLVKVEWPRSTPATSLDDAQTRFELLQTVREYALDQLTHYPSEHLDTRRRHAAYYLNLAERTDAAIISPHQTGAFDRLERELANFRTALAWAVSAAAEAEVALRLARALGMFWYARGYLNEARGWVEAALAHQGEASALVRARTLTMACGTCLRQGDFPSALTYGEEGVQLLRHTSNRVDLAHALGLTGLASLELGDLVRSERLITESLALARAMEHPWHIGGALWGLSQVALRRGDTQRTKELADESLSWWKPLGDRQGTVLVMDVLAAAARQDGDLNRSQHLDEESLVLRRDLGDRPGIGVSLRGIAEVAYRRREYLRAQTLYAESLDVAQEIGDLPGLAASLEGLAIVAAHHDRLGWTTTLLGAAEQARDQIGIAGQSTSPDSVGALDIAREHLSPDGFSAAWDAGRARPLNETVRRAQMHLLRSTSTFPQPERTVVSQPVALSRREQQVATLISQGYDNARIAEELTLTRRTIETHVSNILRKLDLNSRVQIALWAIDYGLTRVVNGE